MYLLHLSYPTGAAATLEFPTAFLRALHVIALASHPVALRVEDPAVGR